MATRFASSSLRRRFAWTVASLVMIGLVTYGAMVFNRAGPRPAPVVALGENQAAADVDDRNAVQIVHKPVGDPPGAKPAGDFYSPRYGYSVQLSGTPWTRWENLAEVVSEAEWGALLGDRARLLILPVSLGSLTARQEALNQALLARLGMAYPSDQLTDFRQIKHEGAEGHAFRVAREVAGVEQVYHIRVLRRKPCAYLLAAWVERSPAHPLPADERALDEALQRVSFVDCSEAAIEPSELTPRERRAQGLVFNDLGRFAHNARDFAGAVQWFRRALEIEPSDPAILINLVDAHVELKQFAEALAELNRHIDRFPSDADLAAGRSFVLAELGQTDQALSAYRDLFATGYRAEAPFTRYIALLADQHRLDEALAAVGEFLNTQESYTIRRLQAGLYRRQGNHDRAVAALTLLTQGRPFSAEVAYDLADSLLAANRAHEALATCRQLLQNEYDTAHTYLLLARSQYALRWYMEARASLETALAREPANDEAQRLLTVVTAMLGEGDNAAIREPIEPVATPAEISSVSEPGADHDDLGQYGAYFVRREVAIHFKRSEEFKLTERRTIRIVDSSGVARFSTIQVPFDPLGEQVFVNSLRVLDAQGNITASSKASDYYVIDSRAAAPTHAKVLNIPVPGLLPGCTIEMETTRRDINPPAEFPCTVHFFSADVPVLSGALYVAADATAVRHKSSAGVRVKPIDGGIVWSIDAPPVYRDEPLGQPREFFVPRTVITSSKATWEQLAAGYLASIAARLQSDPAIVELARRLTADAKDDDARVAALVRYVQGHFTYKPIEFGLRARVPSPAAEIVRNNYGDCKDHALLLLHLLRAGGIEAHLALANLRSPVDLDVPALEQFNHVLVFAPQFRGGRFFDCTDKDSDLLTIDAPLDLGGSQALVLDDRQPRFAEIPAYGAQSSRIQVARTVRLMNQADACVEETVVVQGYHAAFLRGMFKPVPPGNRAAMLQEELSPYADVMQIETLEIENLMQRDQPLVIKAKYVLPNRFQAAGGELVGQLPALWERMYLGVQPVPDRRTPFAIEYPLQFASTVDLIVPDECQVRWSPPPQTNGQSSFASWTIHCEPLDRGLHVAYELSLPAGRYPASDYAAYDADLERAIAPLAQQVVLKKSR